MFRVYGAAACATACIARCCAGARPVLGGKAARRRFDELNARNTDFRTHSGRLLCCHLFACFVNVDAVAFCATAPAHKHPSAANRIIVRRFAEGTMRSHGCWTPPLQRKRCPSAHPSAANSIVVRSFLRSGFPNNCWRRTQSRELFF